MLSVQRLWDGKCLKRVLIGGKYFFPSGSNHNGMTLIRRFKLGIFFHQKKNKIEEKKEIPDTEKKT